MLRVSGLVNNYNYGRFVEEAVGSALAQTRPPEEIVIVDDGSTDDSVARLTVRFGSDSRVRILRQPNQGQLAALAAGAAAATGDLLFFLDADDVWEPEYVARVLDVYEAKSPDMVFTAMRHFGKSEGLRRPYSGDRDFALSRSSLLCPRLPWPLSLTLRRAWIGSPTSAVSAKRWVADAVLPAPDPRDWRICADECFVFGASAVGARKFYLDRPLVRYRAHDNNVLLGRERDRVAERRRELAVERLIEVWGQQQGWTSRQLHDLAFGEFVAREKATFRELVRHACLSLRSSGSAGRKLAELLRMTVHWAARGRTSTT